MAITCASAHADFSCLPTTTATQAAALGSEAATLGSAVVQVETPAAQAEGWWCLLPTPLPDGKRSYAPQYRWNLKKYPTHPDLAGAFRRVIAAPSLLAAVNVEMNLAKIPVTSGTQDAYERDLVIYTACQALAKPPYLVPIDPLPVNWCGTAPVSPAPVPPGWRTPLYGTFRIYTVVNGKLGPSTGRVATSRALCNATVPVVLSGTAKYYPLASGPVTEVTLCELVP